MTYLSLNDEAEGASYMKVTDGALTPEFRSCGCRSAPGCSGWSRRPGRRTSPRTTRPTSASCTATTSTRAVEGEQIRAILGVPLTVEGKVIGALLAVHRTVRPFPAGEVALLTSFAAHAAVALENARLFEQARVGGRRGRPGQRRAARAGRGHRARRARPRPAHRRAAARRWAWWRSPTCWPRCSTAALRGVRRGGPPARRRRGRRRPTGLEDAVEQARASGRCVPDRATAPGWPSPPPATSTSGPWCCAADAPLDLPERRTLERGALVTALVLLFGRTEAEAESRVRGELLADLRRRPRPRHRPGCGSGPGARAPTSTPTLAIAVAEPASDQPAGRAGRRRLGRELHGLGGAPRRAAWSLLAPGDAARARPAAAQPAGSAAATVGVRRAARRAPTESRRAWREARQCLTTLLAPRPGRRGQRPGRARAWPGCCSAATAPASSTSSSPRTLGPVLDYDTDRGTQLAETLEAWFVAGGGLRETADRLHVHPNTVSQRLDRVAQLLGAGLARPGPRCSTCSWRCRWCGCAPDM